MAYGNRAEPLDSTDILFLWCIIRRRRTDMAITYSVLTFRKYEREYAIPLPSQAEQKHE